MGVVVEPENGTGGGFIGEGKGSLVGVHQQPSYLQAHLQ